MNLLIKMIVHDGISCHSPTRICPSEAGLHGSAVGSDIKTCASWDISLDGGGAPPVLPVLTHAWVMGLVSETQPQIFSVMEV